MLSVALSYFNVMCYKNIGVIWSRRHDLLLSFKSSSLSRIFRLTSMKKSRSHHSVICFSLLYGMCALMGFGCSRPRQASATVSGLVQLDGQPVSDGFVLFVSESGYATSAPIQANGAYSAQCLPGTYQVAISPPPEPDPVGLPVASSGSQAETRRKTMNLPRKYQDIGTSQLTADLKAGRNELDFQLQSKAK